MQWIFLKNIGLFSKHFLTASKGVFTFTPLNISFNELPVET
jgi:hypothetical protein